MAGERHRPAGNTSAPHIHLHVQDTPDSQRGTGQAIVFKRIDATLSGKQFHDVSWPMIRGLFVAPTAARARPKTP